MTRNDRFFPDLLRNAFAADINCKVTAAAAAAKDASACAQGAVPVGAGKMCIQSKLVAFMVKSVFAIGIQRIVGFAVPVLFEHSIYLCVIY